MLSAISRHLKEKFKVFLLTDNLVFNHNVIPIAQESFLEITPSSEHKTLAFVDGGQAEILSGGNLSLSFIRIFAQAMKQCQKVFSRKHEFYVLTTAVYRNGEMWYEGKLFPVEGPLLVHEQDLIICSTDASIKSGNERAPIGKVAGMARRFAELKLAGIISADPSVDHVLLDGTLEPTFRHEEKYIQALGTRVSALAKTCSLFTTCGNSPVVLLQKLSPFTHCWRYHVEEQNYFVKLHPKAKHVFRFGGNKELLPILIEHCSDPLFLGYPYGLILADKMARVGNAELNSLKMSILLRDENREIVEYLNAMNAHDILDHLG